MSYRIYERGGYGAIMSFFAAVRLVRALFARATLSEFLARFPAVSTSRKDDYKGEQEYVATIHYFSLCLIVLVTLNARLIRV